MKINVIKYKKVKSTNDTALKLIKKNITKPTLVTTEKQTNGRGRVGKKWISKTGNLFISLFFKFDQKKINFKQFAILNAFLLKKVLSSTICSPGNFVSLASIIFSTALSFSLLVIYIGFLINQLNF